MWKETGSVSPQRTADRVDWEADGLEVGTWEWLRVGVTLGMSVGLLWQHMCLACIRPWV